METRRIQRYYQLRSDTMGVENFLVDGNQGGVTVEGFQWHRPANNPRAFGYCAAGGIIARPSMMVLEGTWSKMCGEIFILLARFPPPRMT